MNYRKKLYSNYISKHTSHLYGDMSLESIKWQFPVWDKYYGKHLPNDKNVNILEIGCGSGGFLYYLKKLGYTNSFGIDISAEQIESAKKVGITDVEQIDLQTFLSRKKDCYAVIVARDILEHFKKEEVLNVLKLVYIGLQENGIFIMQSPNGESPFGRRYLYGDFTHEIAFTRNSLSQILRITGFRKIDFYSTGPVVHGIKSAVRYVLWKIIEIVLHFYMLIETGSGEGIFTQNLIAVAYKLASYKLESWEVNGKD